MYRALRHGWLLPALCALGGCVFDQAWKHRAPTQPEQLDDGWEIATPASVGLDAAALDRILSESLREDRYFGTLALLVVKDGKLVFETYLRSQADRDQAQAVQSATKSFTSLIYGVASERGWAPGLDTTVCSVAPTACRGLDPQKQRITIEQLLTMRSGLDFDNSDFAITMIQDRPADPLRYMLSRPQFAAPGKQYRYRDVDPDLLSHVIQLTARRSERELAEQYLFGPMNIHDAIWETSPDGVSMGAYGLHLKPRDLAKLGRLLLDRGRWNGEQLVPEAWIAAATRAHVKSDSANGVGGYFQYGYYFWVVPEYGAFAAWGHGGQFVLVVPDMNMVLVQVAYPYAELHGSRLEQFIELVKPLLPPPS